MDFRTMLSETARACPDILQRKLLQDRVQELDFAIASFNAHVSTERMQNLVASWTRAQKQFDMTTIPTGGSTAGGAMPVPEMRKVA